MKKICITVLMIFAGLSGSAYADVNLTWSGCGVSKKAFMDELAKAYEKESGIKITIKENGVAKGIKDVADERSDMGGSCRHLMIDEEKNVGLVIVAWDALVAIVNKKNPVKNISHVNLKDVLLGKITSWKQLGGPDRPIEFFEREGKTSGVGMMTRELIFGDADIDLAPTKKFTSSGPIEEAVEQTTWAIAVTGVSSANKRDVKILDLNGVKPSQENLINGQYILARPLYLITKKTRSEEVFHFLKFIKSEKGQEIIEKQGVIPDAKSGSMLRRYRLLMKDIKGSKKGAFE